MMKAIVFDFDGLVFDSETAEFKAMQSIYADYGQELTLETWSKCIGTDISAFNPYEHLDSLLGRSLNHDDVRKERRARYDRITENETIRPGVQDYLDTAQRIGLRIGLASSSPLDWVEFHLRKFGLFEYFEVIRTKEDVAKVKPDPQLYIAAVQGLGVQPFEAVAFEDSLNGMRAALAAGLHCVVVPNSVTHHLPFAGHSLRLGSMADMPLEEVIRQVEAKRQRA